MQFSLTATMNGTLSISPTRSSAKDPRILELALNYQF